MDCAKLCQTGVGALRGALVRYGEAVLLHAPHDAERGPAVPELEHAHNADHEPRGGAGLARVPCHAVSIMS